MVAPDAVSEALGTIKEQLGRIEVKMVTTDLFNEFRTGNSERITRNEGDIRKVESDLDKYKTDMESVKRTRFNAIIVATLSLVVGFILKYFVPGP